MRLILWTIGCVFAAIAVVQLAIEAMLAAFGGSWTRLVSLQDMAALFGGAVARSWLPPVLASAPLWIPALVLGLLFLFLGRFRRDPLEEISPWRD